MSFDPFKYPSVLVDYIDPFSKEVTFNFTSEELSNSIRASFNSIIKEADEYFPLAQYIMDLCKGVAIDAYNRGLEDNDWHG